MDWFTGISKDNLDQSFSTIYNIKKNHRTSDLCFGNTAQLKEFKREVFSYHFKDEPDYNQLRAILTKLKDQKDDEECAIACSIVNK